MNSKQSPSEFSDDSRKASPSSESAREGRSAPSDANGSDLSQESMPVESMPVESLIANWIDIESRSPEVEASAQSISERLSDRYFSSGVAQADSAHAATIEVQRENRSRNKKRSLGRRWGVGLALLGAAAAIAVMVSPTTPLIETNVNADAMLSAAHATHDGPMERIYDVTIMRESLSEDSDLPSGFVQNVRIATQGDRFWVEMNHGPRRWVWGREADGSIWIVLGPHAAVRLAPEEVGEPLRRISDIYSLSIGELLEDLPRGFELHEIPASSEQRYAVEGSNRRPRGPFGMQRVTAELDRSTHEVQRLAIERRLSDQHLTTTTYTLVESKPADTALYSPEGHLDDVSRVIDSQIPLERRREMLTRRLGPIAGRWVRQAQ